MTEPAHARRGSGTKMAAVQDSEKLGNRAEADALGALKIQYCELPAVRIWSYTSHGALNAFRVDAPKLSGIMREYIVVAHTCHHGTCLQDMVDFIVQSAQKGLKAQFKGEKVRAKVMSFPCHSRALLQHGVHALTLLLATPCAELLLRGGRVDQEGGGAEVWGHLALHRGAALRILRLL